MKVYYDTFPLGDYNGEQIPYGSHYPKHPNPSEIKDEIYVAHVSEGIDQIARNEFYNLSRDTEGCVDILSPQVMLIHAMAILEEDAVLIAEKGASVVWSPRSNISLYGNTAPVTLFKKLNINICLGSDWLYSGSINLLRELALVYELNTNSYDNVFSTNEIWEMVTKNPAKALQISDQLGDLKEGYLADFMIVKADFSEEQQDPYSVVTRARTEDVACVARGGKILYGDEELLSQYSEDWDSFQINEKAKYIDTKSEVNLDFDTLSDINRKNYPLILDPHAEEPSGSFIRLMNLQCPGEGLYPIFSKDVDSDQDGIENKHDNAPKIFNPLRPVDILNGKGQLEVQ